MGTVSTGNADRDAHLASSDFFNADTNPLMTFVSTRSAAGDEQFTLVGDLTINGITKTVELDVEFFGTSVFPMDQSTRAGFSATGSISRKEFGIDFNVPLGGDKVMISDKVALELDVQLVAPYPPQPPKCAGIRAPSARIPACFRSGGDSEDRHAVHLAERIGDQLEAFAVGADEVDRGVPLEMQSGPRRPRACP